MGDATGFRQDVWPHPRSRIVAPSSRGEVAAGFAGERNQRRTLDALHPSERDSSARRGGVTPDAARQAIGRIQAPRLAQTTIGLSLMVRRSGSGCRAQTVPGAYRHVGLHLLERREHAPTTSQQGFRNQQPTERRGCDRPRSATPPRGQRGGVPPRRPEGHLVPVAVPVIPRGFAGTKGLPGGAVSPPHTRRRPELHRTAAAQRLVTSRRCPAAMTPKAPCPAEVRLRYGVTPEDAGPGLVPACVPPRRTTGRTSASTAGASPSAGSGPARPSPNTAPTGARSSLRC